MPLDESLFKISPDDLTDDHFIRQMFYRSNLPSVGHVLEQIPRSRLALRLIGPVQSFLSAKESLAVNPSFKRWTPALRAALALFRFRAESKNNPLPFDLYLAKRDFSEGVHLLLELNLQEVACALFDRVPLDILNSIESMPPEMNCEIFKFAMGVYPLEKWTYKTWERYTPSKVLDKEFALLHFRGNLNGRIQEIARSTGWKTLRDFCKHERYSRFMMPNFGASGLEAVLLRLADLSSLNKPQPSLSSFTDRSLLDLFAFEINENPRLQDRWRQALRWRTGFEEETKTYEWIGDRLQITAGRAKQICAKGWKVIRCEEPWQTLVILRLEEINSQVVGRLTLEILEDEEPWFAGVASTPSFFGVLITTLSDGKFEVSSRSGAYFVRKAKE